MDLVQIRYFLALARTLNFTRAAEACHVTQPALTKSIQRLEDELGGPLLLRERSLTQLTELGRTMLPLLEQAYAAAERAKEHAASLRKSTASPLRVGFDMAVSVRPFLPVFAEIAARMPALELTLTEGAGPDLADALLHGTLDAAVLSAAEGLPERLNRWRLFSTPVVLLLRPGDALAEMAAVPPGALAGRAVISGPALPGAGMPPPRHRAMRAEHAMDLVRAGLGVALATQAAACGADLLARPLDPAAMSDVVLAAVAGRPHARAADGFIKLARAREWEAA